jgi:hypothetical protein
VLPWDQALLLSTEVVFGTIVHQRFERFAFTIRVPDREVNDDVQLMALRPVQTLPRVLKGSKHETH